MQCRVVGKAIKDVASKLLRLFLYSAILRVQVFTVGTSCDDNKYYNNLEKILFKRLAEGSAGAASEGKLGEDVEESCCQLVVLYQQKGN
jgi:hypothetical protein